MYDFHKEGEKLDFIWPIPSICHFYRCSHLSVIFLIENVICNMLYVKLYC